MNYQIDTLRPWALNYLRKRQIPFEVIIHTVAHSTEAQSIARGHPLGQAAKTMLMKGFRQWGEEVNVLFTIPGDCRLNFSNAAQGCDLRQIKVTPRREAELLMKCVSGTFPPFALDPTIRLVFDIRLAERFTQYVIGSGSPMLSLKLNFNDLVQVASPLFAEVAQQEKHE